MTLFFLQKVMKKRQSHLTFFVCCNLLLLLLFHFNGLKYLPFSLLLSFFVSLCFVWCVDVCLWVIDNLIFSILSKENFSRFSFFFFSDSCVSFKCHQLKSCFFIFMYVWMRICVVFFLLFFLFHSFYFLCFMYTIFFPPLIFQWYMIMGGIDFQASSLFAVVVNCLFHFHRYFHLMFLFCVVWDNPIFIY